MKAFDNPIKKLQPLLTKDASGEVALRYMTSAEGVQLTAAEAKMFSQMTLEQILSNCVGVDGNGRAAIRLALTT